MDIFFYQFYIVACHLPRAPSYGGVRTWVEGFQMRETAHWLEPPTYWATLRMTVWHRRLQNTNTIQIAIKLPTIMLNIRLTNY